MSDSDSESSDYEELLNKREIEELKLNEQGKHYDFNIKKPWTPISSLLQSTGLVKGDEEYCQKKHPIHIQPKYCKKKSQKNCINHMNHDNGILTEGKGYGKNGIDFYFKGTPFLITRCEVPEEIKKNKTKPPNKLAEEFIFKYFKDIKKTEGNQTRPIDFERKIKCKGNGNKYINQGVEVKLVHGYFKYPPRHVHSSERQFLILIRNYAQPSGYIMVSEDSIKLKRKIKRVYTVWFLPVANFEDWTIISPIHIPYILLNGNLTSEYGVRNPKVQFYYWKENKKPFIPGESLTFKTITSPIEKPQSPFGSPMGQNTLYMLSPGQNKIKETNLNLTTPTILFQSFPSPKKKHKKNNENC